MSVFNTSEEEISTFFLTGIPGMQHAYHWISIVLCFIYLLSILGNCTILYFIKTDTALHEPMYYFLSMLAFSDLGLTLSSLPTMLRVFLFNVTSISTDACIAQEFFIHEFTSMESSVLLVMSVDRYIAIGNPLRYTSILTNARIIKIGLGFGALCFFIILPFPFTLKRLKFCKKNLLSHSYCLHQDIMKLACSDVRVNVIYGMFMALFAMSDFCCISVSYMLILKIVLGIASNKGRLKVLNTCLSHICAVLIFYVPIITLSAIHRIGKNVSPITRIIIADVFILVPPLMNPIVYTVKSQQIRNRIRAKLCEKQDNQKVLLPSIPSFKSFC